MTTRQLRRDALRLAWAALHATGTLRELHARLFPGEVTIVMYHGILKRPLPVPDWCFLPACTLERQLTYLALHFEVVHIEEAFAPGARRGPRPLACITFDDGFASVSELAFPILERLRLPATVYLVTDLVGSEDTVWFARLHQALSESAEGEVQMGALRLPLGTPAERARASVALQRALKRLDRPASAAALAEVLRALGHDAARPPCAPFRILNAAEIGHMSREDLVRFGAHTATHQILTRTTPEDARREIERSVAAVATLVQRPSRSFAYPNGGPGDFDAAAAAAVREAGLDLAVSTIEGPNGPGTDRYALRRYGIGGEDDLSRFASFVHHARAAPRRLLSRIMETGARGETEG